jgi:hypothetical protein
VCHEPEAHSVPLCPPGGRPVRKRRALAFVGGPVVVSACGSCRPCRPAVRVGLPFIAARRSSRARRLWPRLVCRARRAVSAARTPTSSAG